MRLEAFSTAEVWPDPPGLPSLGTESRFPIRVVSVFRLDKATKTTQAGWKLNPWIREASKDLHLSMSTIANDSGKKFCFDETFIKKIREMDLCDFTSFSR